MLTKSMFSKPMFTKFIAALGFSLCMATPSLAAPCGNTSAGFEDWKSIIAAEAKSAGVGQAGIAALTATNYSKATISADRNQKSFKYTLDKFLKVRGADTIISQGRSRKAKNTKLFSSLEAQYGVPAGVLLAIHGMETGFGGFMGDTNIVSAVSTLVWDCRRSDYFKPHLIAALKMVDSGAISPATVGAKHGEWGHTQFLMGNALTFGADGNGDGRVDLTKMADAMATTANYLRQKGWQPGQGYQEGEANFAAIKEWNAAKVYQQAIALMAAKIDR